MNDKRISYIKMSKNKWDEFCKESDVIVNEKSLESQDGYYGELTGVKVYIDENAINGYEVIYE